MMDFATLTRMVLLLIIAANHTCVPPTPTVALSPLFSFLSSALHVCWVALSPLIPLLSSALRVCWVVFSLVLSFVVQSCTVAWIVFSFFFGPSSAEDQYFATDVDFTKRRDTPLRRGCHKGKSLSKKERAWRRNQNGFDPFDSSKLANQNHFTPLPIPQFEHAYHKHCPDPWRKMFGGAIRPGFDPKPAPRCHWFWSYSLAQQLVVYLISNIVIHLLAIFSAVALYMMVWGVTHVLAPILAPIIHALVCVTSVLALVISMLVFGVSLVLIVLRSVCEYIQNVDECFIVRFLNIVLGTVAFNCPLRSVCEYMRNVDASFVFRAMPTTKKSKGSSCSSVTSISWTFICLFFVCFLPTVEGMDGSSTATSTYLPIAAATAVGVALRSLFQR